MPAVLRRLAADDAGATFMEYGLIAALISIVIVASLNGVASTTSASMDSVASGISSAG